MCRCCGQIEFFKEHKNENFKEKIFAKISVYTWSKGERAIKGNQISMLTSRAYDLKYCPSCR